MFNFCLFTLIFIQTLYLSHCVLNVVSRSKFCTNGFFNTFFPLSHTFYFETRPSPLSKIKENAFGAHFLQLYHKNEYSDPHFLFHDFNKDSTSFWWEKNWHKSMFSFLAILLNCTDWAITGRIARATKVFLAALHDILQMVDFFIRVHCWPVAKVGQPGRKGIPLCESKNPRNDQCFHC